MEPDEDGRLCPPRRTTVLVPTRRRSRVALLKAPPRALGWGRTRWSGATRALTLQTTRGIKGSAETIRPWVYEGGWVWKRAQLVAKDDEPQRVTRLARLRYICEQLTCGEALVVADELEIHWLPTVGYAWRPKGTQVEVMTPGRNEKHDLAGALDPTTGTLHPALGPRQTNARFRDLLTVLDAPYPADRSRRLDVVVDH